MCLLGIADYAQIDSYRAPKSKLKLIEIGSPKSQREWRVHQSVRNITPLHEDPECFYVDAEPERIEDYLRLMEWLTGIQDALDTSWAILGEVYGRFSQEGLDRLAFTVRRVRSSILDSSKTFPFVPEKIRFSVAEAEMLSLLLEPLYGDHPGYGVRELVQNAVDAVREAKALEVNHLAGGTTEVAIQLAVAGDVGVLRIRDSGVGMSLNTLKNYFLNAGASFRSSSEWRKDFIDSDGRIEVIRSGRFGVGALAAFIIGPKITVQTRHYDQKSTWNFSASLLDEHIEIRSSQDNDFGTTISIEVRGQKLRDFENFLSSAHDYFEFSDVTVIASIVEEGTLSLQESLRDSSPSIYHFSSQNFESVDIVSRTTLTHQLAPDFVNGIAITSIGKERYRGRIIALGQLILEPFLCGQNHYHFRSKEVSCRVVDRGSNVTLNLARTEFMKPDEDLSDRVADLAFNELVAGLGAVKKLKSPGVIDSNFYNVNRSAFVFNSRGIRLLDKFVLNETDIDMMVALGHKSIITRDLLESLPKVGFIFGMGLSSDASPTSIVYYLRQAKQEEARHELYARWTPERINEVLGIANVPRWLRTKLEGCLVEHTPTSHVDVSFGVGSSRAAEALDAVVQSRVDPNPVCFGCIGTKWFDDFERYRHVETKRDRMPERWILKFAGTGGFSPFSNDA